MTARYEEGVNRKPCSGAPRQEDETTDSRADSTSAVESNRLEGDRRSDHPSRHQLRK